VFEENELAYYVQYSGISGDRRNNKQQCIIQVYVGQEKGQRVDKGKVMNHENGKDRISPSKIKSTW